ncbi:MAG: PrsW family intramembrane metalloprotease [Treponema sp.]|nr:PrsW family intramembrane metalloprotease [Treponema sp.]
MSMYAFLSLCFIPLAAFFLILLITVKGLTIFDGLWAIILGFIAVLPIAFVQYFVLNLPIFNTETFASLLVTAVLFNGVIEESMKMLFILLLPRKRLSLAAFFTSALLFGLALGTLESLVYLVRRIQNNTLPSGLTAAYTLILVRMATAVLIHMFCAGLSSLYIWLFKNKYPNAAPFVYAALLHGVYNFFAGFSSNYRWFSIIAILFTILECRIWYIHILKKSGLVSASSGQK